MKFKLKISKKIVLKLILIAALTGVAVLFDYYFENNPETLEELQTENSQTADEYGTIYLFSQLNSFSAKSSVQKTPGRRLFEQAHDKLLQKRHQLLNYQALKLEDKALQKPLFLSYHHVIFRHFHFSLPDDDPLIS